MTSTIDPLTAGRGAFEHHAWQEAYDYLNEADRSEALSGEGLQMLAEASFWSGHAEEVLEVGERAYGAYVQEGNLSAAAMTAYQLSRQYGMRLIGSTSGGWFARAEQLAANDPASPVNGYLEFMRGFMALQMEGDADKAISHLDEALEIASRTHDRSLYGQSLHAKGWALSRQGKLAEALALMDEAMVLAVGGEMDPVTTGEVYCGMIGMCAHRGDYQRSAEWTDATLRWCERNSITGFPGICRVHRAELMRLHGALVGAEDEARRACDELMKFKLLFAMGDAFYEIGEVRRRLGDFAGAEESFSRAHEYGRDPQPGMSLVHFGQGRIEAAAAGIRRALAENADDALSRVRPLVAQIEIAIAAGDLDTAAAASEELETIVDEVGTTAYKAEVARARGAVRLARGDPRGSIADFRSALHGWQELDAPFEGAGVRVLLGKAYAALGDQDGALLEIRAALETFKRLGAKHAVAQTEAFLRGMLPATAREHVKRALVFTDIVKSTDLVRAMGDEAWEDLLSWHDQRLRAVFSEYSGEVANQTGDGFFVTFDDVDSAIACAVAIQRALLDHRKQTGFSLTVRIGVHLAEATSRGGQDYGGGEVHKAARIGALAGASEIVASEEALGEAGAGLQVSEFREVELKGIPEPVRIATVEWR